MCGFDADWMVTRWKVERSLVGKRWGKRRKKVLRQLETWTASALTLRDAHRYVFLPDVAMYRGLQFLAGAWALTGG